MAVRIKDITTTASEVAVDDYIALDGATNGTRKILASNVGGGGETMIDFETTISPSQDDRGVNYLAYSIYPTDSSVITPENAIKIKAYTLNTDTIYPLIITYVILDTTRFVVRTKSINSSVQSTTGSYTSGTLHIVAPFEINSVAYYK